MRCLWVHPDDRPFIVLAFTDLKLWKQIDFTLIRIAADLCVNFYTTGW